MNDTENLSHHGEGSSILTGRDLFIAQCITKWIETARKFGGIGYGNDWLPRDPDFMKSRLFWRLRAGKEPLPYPAPTAYSCPWYELIEEQRPHWAYELFVSDGRAFIAQCPYEIQEAAEDGTPKIVRFRPYRFKVWKGESPYGAGLTKEVPVGWWIERIEDAPQAPAGSHD